MRILLFLTILAALEAYKAPDFAMQEPMDLLKLIHEKSPGAFKFVSEIQSKVIGAITLLYGTIPRFYMQAVQDIKTKHPDECEKLKEPIEALQKAYMAAATGTKNFVNSHFVNFETHFLKTVPKDERAKIRSSVSARAQYHDGFEILDYTEVFAPTFYGKCNDLVNMITGRLNKTVEECRTFVRTKFTESKPSEMETLPALDIFEGNITEKIGLNIELLTDFIKNAAPLDFVNLVNNLTPDEIIKIEGILSVKYDTNADFFKEVEKNTPVMYTVLSKTDVNLQTETKRLITDVLQFWNDTAKELQGEDKLMDHLIEQANEAFNTNYETFQDTFSTFMTRIVLSTGLELFYNMKPKELTNMRKFVGVHAKDSLRTSFDKKGFESFTDYLITSELVHLNDIIMESMDNVTSIVHDKAAELLKTIDETITNEDFVKFAKKIDTVLEQKLRDLTTMQQKKIRSMIPVPTLLMLNDVPDDEIEALKLLEPSRRR